MLLVKPYNSKYKTIIGVYMCQICTYRPLNLVFKVKGHMHLKWWVVFNFMSSVCVYIFIYNLGMSNELDWQKSQLNEGVLKDRILIIVIVHGVLIGCDIDFIALHYSREFTTLTFKHTSQDNRS